VVRARAAACVSAGRQAVTMAQFSTVTDSVNPYHSCAQARRALETMQATWPLRKATNLNETMDACIPAEVMSPSPPGRMNWHQKCAGRDKMQPHDFSVCTMCTASLAGQKSLVPAPPASERSEKQRKRLRKHRPGHVTKTGAVHE
jgi:hypothetical protein